MLIRQALEPRRDYTDKKRINGVTDVVFIKRHPERFDEKEIKITKLPLPRSAGPADRKLIQELWRIRDCLVTPVHNVWLKVARKGNKCTGPKVGRTGRRRHIFASFPYTALLILHHWPPFIGSLGRVYLS